ncbi:MAG TPA: hypothetical protein VNQ77_06585 [Frankiaceae bacterium]|nr:hypothetical protein [Frankiaceae bacterium]
MDIESSVGTEVSPVGAALATVLAPALAEVGRALDAAVKSIVATQYEQVSVVADVIGRSLAPTVHMIGTTVGGAVVEALGSSVAAFGEMVGASLTPLLEEFARLTSAVVIDVNGSQLAAMNQAIGTVLLPAFAHVGPRPTHASFDTAPRHPVRVHRESCRPDIVDWATSLAAAWIVALVVAYFILEPDRRAAASDWAQLIGAGYAAFVMLRRWNER